MANELGQDVLNIASTPRRVAASSREVVDSQQRAMRALSVEYIGRVIKNIFA